MKSPAPHATGGFAHTHTHTHTHINHATGPQPLTATNALFDGSGVVTYGGVKPARMLQTGAADGEINVRVEGGDHLSAQHASTPKYTSMRVLQGTEQHTWV